MDKQKLTRVATYASVSVAVSLIFIKLIGLWLTGSVGILASLLDSTLDVLASLMILFAVRLAQVPADSEHRFGHGKAEPLAALVQSVFIAGSAIYLLVYAVDRIIDPRPIEAIASGIWIMVVSIVLTALLVTFQRYVVKKTQSTAIAADSFHFISDIAANALVIVGLVLSMFGLHWVDPLLAIVIALMIIGSATKLAKNSSNQLLDIELPAEVREQIQQIILSHRGVEGFNDLRTYQSGPNMMIQFDLEMDDRMPLVKSHLIAEEVTERIIEQFPQADVTIHQEPVSLRSDPEHHQWGCN